MQRFVTLHSLGEITYEDSKLKNGKYVATVIIDKKKSSCYPDEFTTKDDAYEKAAEIALSEWESKYHDTIKKLAVTSDYKIMAKRVVDIVSKYSAGCWSEAFIKIYAEDYKESLPDDWVEHVKSITDELEFTPVFENFLVCLAKKTPEIIPSSTTRPKEPFNQSISELLGQPVPKMIEFQQSTPLTPDEPTRPVPVQYTDSAVWLVHVLVVSAGDQVTLLFSCFACKPSSISFYYVACHTPN